MTRVLPLPAPAKTRRGPSPKVTASRWAGFRSSRRRSSPEGTAKLYRMLRRRIEPTAVLGDQRARLGWPPGAGRVFRNGPDVAQHGSHDPPGLLDVVLAGEPRGVPLDGVEQALLVGPQLVGVGVLADDQLHGLPVSRGPWLLHQGAHRDHQIGGHPEPEVVAGRGEPGEDGGGRAWIASDFS